MASSRASAVADPGVILRPDRLERRDVLVMLVHIALVIGLASVPMRTVGLLSETPGPSAVLGSGLLLLAATATLWRRRAPVVVLAVTGLLSVLEVLWQGQIVAFILLFEALWSPIVHGRRPLARATTGLGILLSVLIIASMAWLFGSGEGLLVGLLLVTVVVLTPMLWGWDVRLHRSAQLTAESLVVTERDLATERAGRAVESERRQIAQDLHDLVAGHLSAVSLHASLATTLPDDEGRSRSLATTQDSARAALRDLRSMIGVLSTTESAAGDGGVALPETTVAWSELADRLRLPGEEATVTIDPRVEDPAAVAPAARAALLRIAAEAVTNSLRHGEAPRSLTIDVQDSLVEMTCTNARRRRTSPGTGLGLPALQSRARAVGGTATASPDPLEPGRWTVRVQLPAADGARP